MCINTSPSVKSQDRRLKILRLLCLRVTWDLRYFPFYLFSTTLVFRRKMSFSSLVPAFFGRGDWWWDAYDYPSRIMDQCFASPIVDEDLLSPRVYRGFLVRPRTQANLASSGVSEVKNDETKFEVSLGVFVGFAVWMRYTFIAGFDEKNSI